MFEVGFHLSRTVSFLGAAMARIALCFRSKVEPLAKFEKLEHIVDSIAVDDSPRFLSLFAAAELLHLETFSVESSVHLTASAHLSSWESIAIALSTEHFVDSSAVAVVER